MQILKSILNRLNNKGTILAIVGLILNLCIQLGFEVQSEKITEVVNIVCTILVSLGILNNPVDNKEAYIPGISDKLAEKTSKIEEPQKTSDEAAADKSTEVSNVKIQVEEAKVEEQPVTSVVEEVK